MDRKEENYDTAYRVRHFKEQGFTGFDIKEFERLFAGKPVSKITLAGTDGILELAEQADDFAMTDEDFESLVQYHLHTCEKRELLGFQSHLLYICQKHGTKEADKSESARDRGQIFRDRHSR